MTSIDAQKFGEVVQAVRGLDARMKSHEKAFAEAQVTNREAQAKLQRDTLINRFILILGLVIVSGVSNVGGILKLVAMF